MGIKYVYTLSSRGHLVLRALHSIRTLSRFVDPADIVVFYTPPRTEADRTVLAGLGVDLREEPAETESFSAFGDEPAHYGEKLKLCSVDAETVVFLDCDTLVLGDIREVLDGTFDFKARPGTESPREPDWREMFQRFNRPYLRWMPNAGFMIFRNWIHQDIRDSWQEFLAADIGYQHGPYTDHREQYALALAVSAYDTEQMKNREHVMEWNDERMPDGIVYHIGRTIENSIDTAPRTFKGNLYNALKSLSEGRI